MKKSDIKKLTKIVESLDWKVSDDNGDFEFTKYSPAGQDFNINASADTLEELKEKLAERYNNFDCSEETYAWLDNSGHGKNGAPYDMKDLYEDMEACQEMLEELTISIHQII